MNKLFILSFAAVTIAASCKKNTPTPPLQKTDLEFNNTLAEPVTIDIYEYDGSGYDEGFSGIKSLVYRCLQTRR